MDEIVDAIEDIFTKTVRTIQFIQNSSNPPGEGFFHSGPRPEGGEDGRGPWDNCARGLYQVHTTIDGLKCIKGI